MVLGLGQELVLHSVPYYLSDLVPLCSIKKDSIVFWSSGNFSLVTNSYDGHPQKILRIKKARTAPAVNSYQAAAEAPTWKHGRVPPFGQSSIARLDALL